ARREAGAHEGARAPGRSGSGWPAASFDPDRLAGVVPRPGETHEPRRIARDDEEARGRERETDQGIDGPVDRRTQNEPAGGQIATAPRAGLRLRPPELQVEDVWARRRGDGPEDDAIVRRVGLEILDDEKDERPPVGGGWQRDLLVALVNVRS